MTTPLSAAAILLLLARPECGHVRTDRDLPERLLAQHLVATAARESGGDPLVIGVNAEPKRGLPAGRILSTTVAEAAAHVRDLTRQGRSFDAGLFQIHDLPAHGLTPETAFDPCHNAAAAAEHLAGNFRVAEWTLAHRLYNCGRMDCGIAYADAVMATTYGSPPVRAGPGPPPPPSPPPCAPEWDAWALAACSTATGTKKP